MSVALVSYAEEHGLGLLEALAHASDQGLLLNAYASPVSDSATDLGCEEAAEIASEDPSLIYLTPTPTPTPTPNPNHDTKEDA